MAELALQIIKWSAKIAVFISVAVAGVLLITFILSLIGVALNVTVIGDLIALIQMWLPFNLDILIAWCFTASGLLISFRLAAFAFRYTKEFLD